MKRSIYAVVLLACSTFIVAQQSPGTSQPNATAATPQAKAASAGSATGEAQQSKEGTPASSQTAAPSATTKSPSNVPAVAETQPSQTAEVKIGSLANTQPPSADLKKRIETALSAEPTLHGAPLTVNVSDTEIALSGSVDTGKQKLAAQRIAQSYATNRRVRDTVTVSSARAPISSRSGQNPDLPASDQPSNEARPKTVSAPKTASPQQQGDQDPNIPKQ